MVEHRIVIGMPAYNEGAALDILLDSILRLKAVFADFLEVLVVNDGSTDLTRDILQRYSEKHSCISYLSHDTNRGLGSAMETVMRAVCQKYTKEDILVTLDADNTHSPQIIPEMVRKLKRDELDIVIASRFADGGAETGLSLKRKLCSRGASYFLQYFFPIPNVRDYSSGYRAYRVSYLKKALDLYQDRLITTTGFECMAEILARFSKIGVLAGEYPLHLQYHLKEGKSKMKIARTILGYCSLVHKVKPPLVN